VSWLVKSQPQSGSREVNGEDQRGSEGDEGESGTWRLSFGDGGTGSGAPGGDDETYEHTDCAHDGVP